MKKVIIVVKPNGAMWFIHDDRLRGLLRQGEASIRRASHVEPGDPAQGQEPLKWYVDLSPSGSHKHKHKQKVLGPFDTRQEALDAEVAWINQHVLTEGSCQPTI